MVVCRTPGKSSPCKQAQKLQIPMGIFKQQQALNLMIRSPTRCRNLPKFHFHTDRTAGFIILFCIILDVLVKETRISKAFSSSQPPWKKRQLSSKLST